MNVKKELMGAIYTLRAAHDFDYYRDAVYQAFTAKIQATPARALEVRAADILTMITRHLVDEYTLGILPPHVAPTDAGQLATHAHHIHQQLTTTPEQENKE